jgi:prophage tail gpP-like protein
MAWPNPKDVAVLTVDGTNYTDWESVEVRHQLREQPLFFCRFTASEIAPFADNWAALHIMPGADCTVHLGGALAFTGRVTTRQVFYDAKRHFIEIQAANGTEIITGSIEHDSHEFKQKTAEQMIREVLQPTGLNLKIEGGALPTDKFDMSAHPGTKIVDFLDKVTRHASQSSGLGISFTSNTSGDFVVMVGPNGGADEVTEGVNILEGRETIFDPWYLKQTIVMSQGPGTNKQWGPFVAIPFASGDQQTGGTATGKISQVVLSDISTTMTNLLKGRTTSEHNWMMEDHITAWATVHGWFRPSGGLWYRGQNVTVNSPMLVLNGIELILKVVRFTQDDRTGTRTNLELVNANVLKNLAAKEQS